MIILLSLILATLIVLVVFVGLVLLAVNKLFQLSYNEVIKEHSFDVQKQKIKKPILPLKKQESRGRSVVNSEDLVDIADLPWEDGYKALEDLGNG